MDSDMLISRIEELAKQKGVSKTKALTESGAGKDFIANIKKGQTPSVAKLQKLSEYFGVSTDYLLGTVSTVQAYDENDNLVVIDDETRDIIDSLRTNPEMKMLFSVTKKATKDDIIKAVKIIEALKDNG